MKKIQKRILGLLGLVLVAVMTVVAAFMPGPDAAAVDITEVTDTIEVTVLDEVPSAKFLSPSSGSLISSLNEMIGVKYVYLDEYRIYVTYIDSNGNEYTDPEPVWSASHLKEAGETSAELSLPFRELGQEYGYGTYILKIEGTGLDGVEIKGDFIKFEYVAVTGGVTMDDNTGTAKVELNYDEDDPGLEDDEKVAKIVITVYDEARNPVAEIPPITVEAPGKYVEIPFDVYGLPSGNYEIRVQPYNADGDELYRMLKFWVRYDEFIVPSTADTGGLFKNLNISQTDYLVTGVGLFLVVGVGGIFIINKRSKSSSKRRK